MMVKKQQRLEVMMSLFMSTFFISLKLPVEYSAKNTCRGKHGGFNVQYVFIYTHMESRKNNLKFECEVIAITL